MKKMFVLFQVLQPKGFFQILKKNFGHNLKHLDLSGSAHIFTPDCVRLVTQECMNLEYLNISKMDISNQSFRTIKHLTKLKELNLSYCSRITDVSIARIFMHCKRLETIDMTFCHLIVGSCFANSTDSLRNLNIDQCERVILLRLAVA